MILKSIHLQNFRNYKKAEFVFDKDTTIIIGQNTAGKSNLIEAIYFLSVGKSFKGSDEDALMFGENIGRIKTEGLEIVLARIEGEFRKRYLVNGVARQRVKFIGSIPCVLFTPQDLDIVTSSPSKRRNYIDSVLEQADLDYRRAMLFYEKALRARNHLLDRAKKQGIRDDGQFEYWDNILIINGNVLTKQREKFLEFVNNSVKDIFKFKVIYDKSVISKERLIQYKDAELASGVTLVGPHRDDFSFEMKADKDFLDIKTFGSRGQQRLTVLQLKIIELDFLNKKLNQKPLLLLDDIFSELDEGHINLVLDMIKAQQTVITTTHKEFVENELLKNMNVIELGK